MSGRRGAHWLALLCLAHCDDGEADSSSCGANPACDASEQGAYPGADAAGAGSEQDTPQPVGGGSSDTAPGGTGPGESAAGAVPADPLASTLLEAHNRVRAEAQASSPLPALRWSADLAAYAQAWADHLTADGCGFYHRSEGRYGENLFASWPPSEPETAVASWASEAACWTYGPLTIDGTHCDHACAAALNASSCGHYTQLVWRATERVGCGAATCEGRGVWVCNYDPPGNVIDQVPY